MALPDKDVMRAKLGSLIAARKKLDDTITAYSCQSTVDQLQIQRLKKEKLRLKDQITQIKAKLLPDIIA